MAGDWRLHWGRCFFVISGFLITKIILKDYTEGNFSFSHFYSRRVLRLFPALITVLLFFVILSGLVFSSNEFKALGKHLAGSALFVSNFFFWLEAGYFDESAISKPLLHLWSLGIEEQYYLVWPLALLLLLKKRKIAMFTIMIAIGGSFALNLYYLDVERGFAFYMPFTRGWELLMGAALSFWQWSTPQRSRGKWTSVAFDQTAPYFGLGLIAYATFSLSDQTPYPGYHALLPAFGTFFLLAGESKSWLQTKVLSHPFLVLIGLISYPLYLWHWPFLSFASIMDTQFPPRELRIALVFISIILAWLTYRFIEQPIRKTAAAKTINLLLLGMFAVGVGGGLIFFGDGLPKRYGIEAFEKQYEHFEFSMSGYPTEDCQRKFPNSGWCFYGEKNSPTVALIGDSHAHQFFPGLEKEYALRGENLVLLGSAGCPPLLDIVSYENGGDDWCNDANAYITAVVEDSTIQTVILAASWHLYVIGKRFSDDLSTPSYWRLDVTSEVHDQSNEGVFSQQLANTLKLLQDSGKKVIIIKQIPELDFHPKACLDRPLGFITPLDCQIDRALVDAYLHEYEAIFEAVIVEFDDILVLDPVPYMCSEENCFTYVGDYPLYRDATHLSLFGSNYLAQRWRLF